jgi:hypothetical protein
MYLIITFKNWDFILKERGYEDENNNSIKPNSHILACLLKLFKLNNSAFRASYSHLPVPNDHAGPLCVGLMMIMRIIIITITTIMQLEVHTHTHTHIYIYIYI